MSAVEATPASPPRPSVGGAALAALEERVERALGAGADAPAEHGLEVLGYGEITLVLAWRGEAGAFACKRLPPVTDRARLERYRALFEEYVARLEAGGVRVLDTTFELLTRPDGRHVGWCVQPILPVETLGPRWLRAADLAVGARFLGAVCARIAAWVGGVVGLDGQLSNWARVGEEPVYLDLTTPLLRDGAGREQIDLGLLLSALPALVRWPVRRFLARRLLDHYYSPRAVLLDLLANLQKERLDRWLEPGLALANERLAARGAPPLSEGEVRRYYREDARTWGLLLTLRRIDRWWQRRVRGRVYPFLLPPPIAR